MLLLFIAVIETLCDIRQTKHRERRTNAVGLFVDRHFLAAGTVWLLLMTAYT